MRNSTLHSKMVLWILSAAWTACLLPAYAQDKKAPRITEIIVSGNRVLNTSGIILSSGLKVGDLATSEAINRAYAGLRATGVFGAQHPKDDIEIHFTDLNREHHEVKVIIAVQENDVVRGINITGSGPIPAKNLRAQLWTKPGYVLNLNTLGRDINRIQEYYDRKGYIATGDLDTSRPGERRTGDVLANLGYHYSYPRNVDGIGLSGAGPGNRAGYYSPGVSLSDRFAIVDDTGLDMPNGILTLPIVVEDRKHPVRRSIKNARTGRIAHCRPQTWRLLQRFSDEGGGEAADQERPVQDGRVADSADYR